MKRPKLIEYLEIANYEIVQGDEAIRIAHAWLSAFCPQKNSFKGIRRFKTYMWDIIDCDLENEEAVKEYEKYESPRYVIMEDCFGQDEKEVYIVEQKPLNNVKLQDFHVFPKNLAWSMAFTHEDGWIGPKFTKNKDFEKLNRKNANAIKAINRGYG